MAQDKRQVDAITARDVDFAQWYTDVCKKAELIDYIHPPHAGTYRTFATGSAFIEKRIGILPLNSVSGEGK